MSDCDDLKSDIIDDFINVLLNKYQIRAKSVTPEYFNDLEGAKKKYRRRLELYQEMGYEIQYVAF